MKRINKQLYNVMNYNTIIKEDISEMIIFFLEGLQNFNEEHNIIMSKTDIQKAINNFKKSYPPNNIRYYSIKEHYETITDSSSNNFFQDIVK
jgi:hypothetical protein